MIALITSWITTRVGKYVAVGLFALGCVVFMLLWLASVRHKAAKEALDARELAIRKFLDQQMEKMRKADEQLRTNRARYNELRRKYDRAGDKHKPK